MHKQRALHRAFTSCCDILAAYAAAKLQPASNTIQYNLVDPEVTHALLVATAVFIATAEAKHIFQREAWTM